MRARRRLPSYFLSSAVRESALEDIPRQLGVAPDAVLAISSGWGEPELTIAAAGAPAVAARVRQLMQAAGITARLDSRRAAGPDALAALQALYPSGQIPMLQLSLKAGADAAFHFAAGQALEPLRDEGVLLIGGGANVEDADLLALMVAAGAAARERVELMPVASFGFGTPGALRNFDAAKFLHEHHVAAEKAFHDTP